MKDGFYAVRNGEIYEIEIQCPFPKDAKTIKIPMINPFVVTNGDRIRSMNDEELARFLMLSPEMEFEVCQYCVNGNTVPDDRGRCLRPDGWCYVKDRCEAFKKWLKQEGST